MSAGARASLVTSISSNSKVTLSFSLTHCPYGSSQWRHALIAFLFFLQKKPLSGDLLEHLSSRMDEASQTLKDVLQRFLDALVDSTFKFTDQPLDPSEVLYFIQ
jgi:hypothetical protein